MTRMPCDEPNKEFARSRLIANGCYKLKVCPRQYRKLSTGDCPLIIEM